MRHHPFISRAAAVVAAGALALGLTGTAPPAVAEPAPSPAEEGATWLASQTRGNLVHNRQYDFDDYGLTADVALALVDLGRADKAGRMADALANNVDAWTTFERDVYAGSVAKAVVVAQATGRDPKAFGGVNLVKRLNNRVSSEALILGRIEDRSKTDYTNVIGQALAARALAVAGSGQADEVVGYLLQQQCSEGYFRLSLSSKTRKNQSCDAGSATGISAPDTDVTALAVLALGSMPSQDEAVQAAIAAAVSWLEGQQKDDGSFGGGTSTEASNTNSTGLAGWALGDAGSCVSAVEAARWVRKWQVKADQAGPLGDEVGAIAYDRPAFKAGKEDGIGKTTRDQWRRATAQAAPALPYLDAACQA